MLESRAVHTYMQKISPEFSLTCPTHTTPILPHSALPWFPLSMYYMQIYKAWTFVLHIQMNKFFPHLF